jgi:hypothetical protein
LEASFQIARIEPWFTNIGKRLVKSPKVYWSDTGFWAHLLGLKTWNEVATENMGGPLTETFVMMEVSKHLQRYAPTARLHFFRSHDGLEIDGLIVDGMKRLPFEIKASTTVRTEDARSLESYMTRTGEAEVGLLFYRGEEVRRLTRNVLATPLTALLA